MKKILSVILAFSLVFTFTACNKENAQIKSVTVEVNYNNTQTLFEFETSLKTLGELLREEKLAEGEESTYGLYIKSVNGIKADEEKQEWWCITKNGEQVMAGADSIKLEDNTKYELTLKTGY